MRRRPTPISRYTLYQAHFSSLQRDPCICLRPTRIRPLLEGLASRGPRSVKVLAQRRN